MVFALRCNAGLRMLSGFLTMYMAFLLRQHPLPGWEHRTTLLMGLVIGAAGLGNTIGIGLGSMLRKLKSASRSSSPCWPTPPRLVVAIFYGLIPAIAARTHGRRGPGDGQARRWTRPSSATCPNATGTAFARSETLCSCPG